MMTFFQVGEYKFWEDKALGAKRAKLLEKKTKHPQVKAHEQNLGKNPNWREEVPGIDFTFTNI